MDNLRIYNAVRAVPKEAQKPIGGGRLKGMTDINPMWRIKCLTEQFGVCGFGWYYDITDKWIETSMAKDEITANVKINLYIKIGDEWSKPIQGIGGSKLVASENKGLYVNDECYKMALTDAISVACKALGVGADIYWQSDNTKYNDVKKENAPKISKGQAKTLTEFAEEVGSDMNEILKYYGLTKLEDMNTDQYGSALSILKGKKDGTNR